MSNKRAFSLFTAVAALLTGCRGNDKSTHKPAAAHAPWFASFSEGQSKSLRFDASDYLESLTFRQRNEQLRDWALAWMVTSQAGSAADAARTLGPFEVRRVENLTSPDQQRGSLRWCALPNGNVLALVPADNATVREQRLGALIDTISFTRDVSHSTIHIFEYSIDPDPDNHAVRITRLPSEPISAWWTQARGYFSARISSAADLKEFIGNVDDLTEVRFEQDNLVLSGRAGLFHNVSARFHFSNLTELRQADARWRIPTRRINRAVQDFNSRYGQFSGTREEVARIKAEADRAKAAIEKMKEAEAQRTDVRTVAGFSLDPKPEGAANPDWQQARYDGDLQGTETGMVLFYTDLTAKLWALNIDGSFPWVISGFQPQIALGLSEPDLARLRANPWTRIWFGPRSDRLFHESSRLRLAPIAVKIFAKSFERPGTRESAPNPASSQFVNWWNAHYGEVSRWEPEYERLNQIVKWSLVFEWLERYHANSTVLDFLDEQPVRRDRWFPEWAREQGSNLKFRRWEQAHFNTRGAHGPTESMGILSSKSVRIGNWEHRIVGGVSLASPKDLEESQKKKPVIQEWIVQREGKSLRVEGNNGRTLYSLDGDQAMVVRISERSRDRIEFQLHGDTVTAKVTKGDEKHATSKNHPGAEKQTGETNVLTTSQKNARMVRLQGDLTNHFLAISRKLVHSASFDPKATQFFEIPRLLEEDFDKAMISSPQELTPGGFGPPFTVTLDPPLSSLPWAIQVEGKTYVRVAGSPETPFHGRVNIASLKTH